MNLYDALPYIKNEPVKIAKTVLAEVMAKRAEVVSVIKGLQKLGGAAGTHVALKILEPIVVEFYKYTNQIVLETFTEFGGIPTNIPAHFSPAEIDTVSNYSSHALKPTEAMVKFSKSPRVLTRNIDQLARDTGKIVMPYDYFDHQTFGIDPHSGAGWQVTRMKKAAAELGMALYFVAPAYMYSAQNHAKTASEMLHIVGPEETTDTAFFALHMMVPFMQDVMSQLDALKNEIKALRTDISRVDKDLSSVDVGVSSLMWTVDKRQRDVARRMLSDTPVAPRVKPELDKGMEEVMLFALQPQRELSVNSDFVFVGPTWGLSGARSTENNEGMKKLIRSIWG